MVLKFLVYCQLFVSLLAYDLSRFPAPFQTPKVNPVFLSRYNLNQNILIPMVLTCPNNQDWGLTFDDGPSMATIPLLDYFKSQNIKITFFVVGSQVYQYPEILIRAYSDGHQIGLHTWSHTSLTSLDTESIVSELEWTSELIQELIGVQPRFYRPPYGDIDDRVRSITSAMGLTAVIWNYDTVDYVLNSNPYAYPEGQIEMNVQQTAQDWRLKNNGIISLQHDIGSVSASKGPGVVQRILSSGMNIKRVSDCIGQLAYK
ncbi:hypothetical protein BC833DRAFT_623824 [Globomyces pollinis-pini]|nr:hypothetical protein BC833DRAFT_623824 [Globomyces pollinis-pini]